MAMVVSFIMVLARSGTGGWLLGLLGILLVVVGSLSTTEAFLVGNHAAIHPHLSQCKVSIQSGFGVASLSSSKQRVTKGMMSIITPTTRTTLAYKNNRDDESSDGITTRSSSTTKAVPSVTTSKIFSPSQSNNNIAADEEEVLVLRRQQLKDALSVAAIEEYDMDAYNAGMTTMAEEYMKCLEDICPWPDPAYHAQLNARWSFVFTGVPTIGMKLITLLSRISVGIPILEFDNVFLEVSKNQSQVKAIVKVQLWGNPIELNVYTRLSRPNNNQNVCDCWDGVAKDDDHGKLLIETFDKLVLMGHEVPTPASWKSSRTLHITYLDDDMMIARTNGGEPHLLLRHSPCGTDDDTCDLDTEDPTPFFQEAMNKYGRHLSRSLVDRAYTIHSETKGTLDLANIMRLIHGILAAPNGHD